MQRENRKVKVMVLYGGRSGEHEISLISAASVVKHLDPDRYEVLLVAVDKQGRWLLTPSNEVEKGVGVLPIPKNASEVFLLPHPGASFGSTDPGFGNGLFQLQNSQVRLETSIDVVFPVMHGPLYEDGALQGFLELAEIPYVGSGILGSTVGMDKDVSKRLARDAGLPIVPFLTVRKHHWRKDFDQILNQIEKNWSYPIFVKPANMGSSVGVHKVKNPSQLKPALEDAFRYDTKVLIEKGIEVREIEFAVLENHDENGRALVSLPGEIQANHDFYSYEAKYLDENGAEMKIPAALSSEKIAEGQELARKAFEILGCEGLARIDFFVEKNSGAFYFNEVNTLPGFTSISMYPKLWQHSGIQYTELLTRLIDLAIARQSRKKNLLREFKSK